VNFNSLLRKDLGLNYEILCLNVVELWEICGDLI